MLRLFFATLLTGLGLAAQAVVQVPLAYNWNGIAHAGETGLPNAPAGFRSISDRGRNAVPLRLTW